MKTKVILLLAVFGISCHTMNKLSQSVEDMTNLKINIEKKLSPVQGDFAVAFKDMQSGETIFINEKRHFMRRVQ